MRLRGQAIGLRWLGTCICYFLLSDALYVADFAITQPCPLSELPSDARSAVWISLFLAGGMVVLFPLGVALQKAPADLAFYPTVREVPAVCRSQPARMVVSCGAALLLGYAASTAFQVWARSQYPHGMLWPPRYLFVVGVLGWCGLWLAETMVRPRRGSFWAAVIFTCWAGVVVFPVAFGVLTE